MFPPTWSSHSNKEEANKANSLTSKFQTVSEGDRSPGKKQQWRVPRARTGGCSRKCRAGLVEKRVGEVEGLATWMSGGWRLSRGNSDTECPV